MKRSKFWNCNWIFSFIFYLSGDQMTFKLTSTNQMSNEFSSNNDSEQITMWIVNIFSHCYNEFQINCFSSKPLKRLSVNGGRSFWANFFFWRPPRNVEQPRRILTEAATVSVLASTIVPLEAAVISIAIYIWK